MHVSSTYFKDEFGFQMPKCILHREAAGSNFRGANGHDARKVGQKLRCCNEGPSPRDHDKGIRNIPYEEAEEELLEGKVPEAEEPVEEVFI